jgi:hypothetical protein
MIGETPSAGNDLTDPRQPEPHKIAFILVLPLCVASMLAWVGFLMWGAGYLVNAW